MLAPYNFACVHAQQSGGHRSLRSARAVVLRVHFFARHVYFVETNHNCQVETKAHPKENATKPEEPRRNANHRSKHCFFTRTPGSYFLDSATERSAGLAPHIYHKKWVTHSSIPNPSLSSPGCAPFIAFFAMSGSSADGVQRLFQDHGRVACLSVIEVSSPTNHGCPGCLAFGHPGNHETHQASSRAPILIAPFALEGPNLIPPFSRRG